MTHQDPVDLELEAAESQASPLRFGAVNPQAASGSNIQKEQKTETGEPIERLPSHSSYSSVSTTSPERPRRTRADSQGMARAPTQRDRLTELERNDTHMSRIQTQRTQHSGTVGTGLRSRASRKPIPSMGHGKPMPPSLPDREEYVVEFDGEHDPMHAQNWSTKKKIFTAAMLAYTTFIAAAGSSIFSAAIPTISEKFGVNREGMLIVFPQLSSQD
jgi:DHA1 family multidrug resistance protein-like MFS transporter